MSDKTPHRLDVTSDANWAIALYHAIDRAEPDAVFIVPTEEVRQWGQTKSAKMQRLDIEWRVEAK